MAPIPDQATPPCPDCGEPRSHRWGAEHGSQRYRCRSCRKTFTPHSGTAAARLRHKDKWQIYSDATHDGLGVRLTAAECNVAPSTVQRWRHRLDAAILAREAPPPVSGLISFFSGVGGLDLGFERAGFRALLANEVSHQFADGYEHARAGLGIPMPKLGLVRDTAESFLQARRDELCAAMREARRAYQMVGFIGGPPCPDFSIAGKNIGSTGKHGRMTQVYVDLIVSHQPDYFIFENVPGLYTTKHHREFYDVIKGQLGANGFALTDKLVHALEYGVPQRRIRLFLFGFRRESFPAADVMAGEFPWAAHARYSDADDASWPKTVPFSEGGQRRWPSKLPTRFRVLTAGHWFVRNKVEGHPNGSERFMPRSGLHHMQTVAEGDTGRKSFKRLHRYRYSPTLCYGHNEVHLHPNEARRLTVAEALALQSFPPEFSLPSTLSLSSKFRAVSNAVPYRLAYGLALALADTLTTAQRR